MKKLVNIVLPLCFAGALIMPTVIQPALAEEVTTPTTADGTTTDGTTTDGTTADDTTTDGTTTDGTTADGATTDGTTADGATTDGTGTTEQEEAPVKLPGDILINNDTENASIVEVTPNQELTYTATLDVRSIRDKINGIAEEEKTKIEQLNELLAMAGKPTVSLDDVALSDVESIFTATFNIPAGLEVQEPENTTLSDNILFKVADGDITLADGKLTVKMTLQKDYTKFVDLQKDVNSVADNTNPLVLTIPKVKVTSTEDGQQLTIIGTVDGSFSAKASLLGVKENRNFSWVGIQTREGKDFIIPEEDADTTIQATVKVKNEDTDKPVIAWKTTKWVCDGKNLKEPVKSVVFKDGEKTLVVDGKTYELVSEEETFYGTTKTYYYKEKTPAPVTPDNGGETVTPTPDPVTPDNGGGTPVTPTPDTVTPDKPVTPEKPVEPAKPTEKPATPTETPTVVTTQVAKPVKPRLPQAGATSTTLATAIASLFAGIGILEVLKRKK